MNFNDKETFLKAAKCCKELGSLYEEMANLYDAEDTQENMDKMTMLVGKLMIKASEMQKLG